MVSSDTVGAVWCGRPLICRDFYSFKIMPSRSRNADTRGTLIIPQKSFFAYNNFSRILSLLFCSSRLELINKEN